MRGVWISSEESRRPGDRPYPRSASSPFPSLEPTGSKQERPSHGLQPAGTLRLGGNHSILRNKPLQALAAVDRGFAIFQARPQIAAPLEATEWHAVEAALSEVDDRTRRGLRRRVAKSSGARRRYDR